MTTTAVVTLADAVFAVAAAWSVGGTSCVCDGRVTSHVHLMGVVNETRKDEATRGLF